MPNHNPFVAFVRSMSDVVGAHESEADRMKLGGQALATLVENDTWLPSEYAVPRIDRYQQFLLYCDPEERFSVVSFVWGPGQSTPIHDHCTWGLVGVLRGRERSQRYEFAETEDGQRAFGPIGTSVVAAPGEVDMVSPLLGDIHTVANDSPDEIAISIHVYGGNIGTIRRHTYDESGATREFISGYTPTPLAALWA